MSGKWKLKEEKISIKRQDDGSLEMYQEIVQINTISEKEKSNGSNMVGVYYPSSKIFYKQVKPEDHFFAKYQSYNISKKIFDVLETFGVKVFELKESGGKNRYLVSTYDMWLKSAIPVNEDGFESQWALPVEEWYNDDKTWKKIESEQKGLGDFDE